MMSDQGIRWEQRFSNFNKALAKLDLAVKRIKERHYTEGVLDEGSFDEGDDIIKEGLIQRFEYTHGLAWKVMKDYAYYQGNPEVGGSRDATREALKLHLFKDGKIWMNMIQSRNRTSHTYNEDTANEIFTNIIEYYHPAFLAFQKVMEENWHINTSTL